MSKINDNKFNNNDNTGITPNDKEGSDDDDNDNHSSLQPRVTDDLPEYLIHVDIMTPLQSISWNQRRSFGAMGRGVFPETAEPGTVVDDLTQGSDIGCTEGCITAILVEDVKEKVIAPVSAKRWEPYESRCKRVESESIKNAVSYAPPRSSTYTPPTTSATSATSGGNSPAVIITAAVAKASGKARCKEFKFGQSCLDSSCSTWKLHEICKEGRYCQNLDCQMGHPRFCKGFSHRGICQFGKTCRDRHISCYSVADSDGKSCRNPLGLSICPLGHPLRSASVVQEKEEEKKREVEKEHVWEDIAELLNVQGEKTGAQQDGVLQRPLDQPCRQFMLGKSCIKVDCMSWKSHKQCEAGRLCKKADCEKGHPRICRGYAQSGICIFGTKCMDRHLNCLSQIGCTDGETCCNPLSSIFHFKSQFVCPLAHVSRQPCLSFAYGKVCRSEDCEVNFLHEMCDAGRLCQKADCVNGHPRLCRNYGETGKCRFGVNCKDRHLDCFSQAGSDGVTCHHPLQHVPFFSRNCPLSHRPMHDADSSQEQNCQDLWISPDAEVRAAGFVYGPFEAILPLLQRWDPNDREANKNNLTCVVAIRLGIIEGFCLEGKYGGKDFPEKGSFSVESGDVHMARAGNVEILGTVKPSSWTTFCMIKESGGRQVHQDILRRLAQQHPDYFILGVMYKGGDIQPFISETAIEDADESPADIMFRGLQEELKMTLSDARRKDLASNFKGPYGYNRDRETRLANSIFHDVEVPIFHGQGVDYTLTDRRDLEDIDDSAPVLDDVTIADERGMIDDEDIQAANTSGG